MKPKNQNLILVKVGLLSACAVVGSGFKTIEMVSADSEEELERQNQITFTVGNFFIDDEDNEDFFLQRNKYKHQGFGGIETLDWFYEGDDYTLKVDGRSIFRNDTGYINLRYSKYDWGYINLGYSNFLSHDYNAGEYFAPLDLWYEADYPHMTRRHQSFWMNGRLQRPDSVVLSIGYRFDRIDGYRNSTILGDTYSTTISGPPRRGIVPNIHRMDRKSHKVEVSIQDELEQPSWGVGARFERNESTESRKTERSVEDPDDSRTLKQDNESSQDLFNVHGFIVNQINDSMFLTTTASYASLDGDFSGNRIYGSGANPVYDPGFERRLFNDQGYLNLEGNTELEKSSARLQLVSKPSAKWNYLAILKFNHLNFSSYSDSIDTNYEMNWSRRAREFTEAERNAASSKDLNEIISQLEVRYKGFKSANIYAKSIYGHDNGDINESWRERALMPIESGSETALLQRSNQFDRDTLKLQAGINWYLMQGLSFRINGYYRERSNNYDFDDTIREVDDFTVYPNYIEKQEYKTSDINVLLSCRPFSFLKLDTRFDYQKTKVNSASIDTRMTESSDIQSQIWSASLSIIPTSRIYAVMTAHFAQDRIKTPSNYILGTFENTVPVLENDYINASVSLFAVVTDYWDVQLTYYIYEADNYVDNSDKSQPYGEDAKEFQGGIVNRLRLAENMQFSIQYGVFDYENSVNAGRTDYTVHAVISKLQLTF